MTDLRPNCRLASLADTVKTNNQGVYIDVIQRFLGLYAFWIYVGCAFGLTGGVDGRVKCHQSETHRAKFGCRHYAKMEQPDVKWNFVLLVSFATAVDPTIVFLAESAMACLFGSYPVRYYQEIRAGINPPPSIASRRNACNASEPLTTIDKSWLSSEWREEARGVLQDKLVNGGYWKVTNAKKSNNQNHFYICFGKLQVPILFADAVMLDIHHGDWLEIQCFLADPDDTRNLIRWARQAIPSDPGFRLIIHAARRKLDGSKVEAYLSRHAISSIAWANSIVKVMEGNLNQVMDEEGEDVWGSDCCPLWGKWADRVSHASWDIAWEDRDLRLFLEYNNEAAPSVQWKMDVPKDQRRFPKVRVRELLPLRRPIDDPSNEEISPLGPLDRINVEWFGLHPHLNLPVPGGRAARVSHLPPIGLVRDEQNWEEPTIQVDVDDGEDEDARMNAVAAWFARTTL